MSDNTNIPTPRTEAVIDSCGDYEKPRTYIARLHDFARKLERETTDLERRLSAAVAERDAEKLITAIAQEQRDTLQARVRVLESAIRGFDDAIAKLQGVKLHEATCRALNDATAAGRAALTPPSTLAIDAAAYGGPLPPADPQGDPYRDALAEFVAARDEQLAAAAAVDVRAKFRADNRLQSAFNRARALLSGTDAQQEGKS